MVIKNKCLPLYRVKEITQPTRRVPGTKKIEKMKANLNQVKEAAKKFIEIADELNEKVSRYFNGSESKDDENAYWAVREADKKFIDALNSYYEESYEYGLNYELAESFI